MRAAPDWLIHFQEQMSQNICQPLLWQEPQVQIPKEAYSLSLLGQIQGVDLNQARERMALANGQYWFRLLTAMQKEFPCLAYGMGLWDFNRMAQMYLQAQPPMAWDLALIGASLRSWMQNHGANSQSMEALEFDLQWSRIWNLAPAQLWIPQGTELGALMEIKLQWNSTWGRLTVHWDWLSFRQQILQDPQDQIPLRDLADPRSLLIWRDPHLNLHLHFAETWELTLIDLLDDQPVGLALDRLEEIYPQGDLPLLVQNFFHRGFGQSWWIQPSSIEE